MTFDLIAHPERIVPAYGIYAIFLGAGAGLCVVAVLSWRKGWRHALVLSVFAPIFMLFAVFGTAMDLRETLTVRDLVRRGEYRTVEGCLTAFHRGASRAMKSMAGDERWSVAGYDFSYGTGDVRPGYHRVEANGGIVHANSRARVSFVTSPYYGREEIIVRLQASETCPWAPDPGDALTGN